MATKKRFRVPLEKHETSQATLITIPFDVPATFGTRARVPVRGTINNFPYRSSIVPVGGKFILVVNRELRAGASAKSGDTVSVTLERDDEPRNITPPADLARAPCAPTRRRRPLGTNSATRTRRNTPAPSKTPNAPRHACAELRRPSQI